MTAKKMYFVPITPLYHPIVLTILCLSLLHFPEHTTVSCDHTVLRCACLSHDSRACSLLFNQMAVSQQEDVRGQSRLLQHVRSTWLTGSIGGFLLVGWFFCFGLVFSPLRSEQTSQNWTAVPRTPWVRTLWRRRVLRARRGVAVAVRGAHQRLEEREEAGAGQVSGSRITWRSRDKENVPLFKEKLFK